MANSDGNLNANALSFLEVRDWFKLQATQSDYFSQDFDSCMDWCMDKK